VHVERSLVSEVGGGAIRPVALYMACISACIENGTDPDLGLAAPTPS
jgi:hypothetical protein